MNSREQNRLKAKRYADKHREEINAKARSKYWENQANELEKMARIRRSKGVPEMNYNRAVNGKRKCGCCKKYLPDNNDTFRTVHGKRINRCIECDKQQQRRNYKEKVKDVECKFCGKQFETKKRKLFCTISCYNKWVQQELPDSAVKNNIMKHSPKKMIVPKGFIELKRLYLKAQRKLKQL